MGGMVSAKSRVVVVAGKYAPANALEPARIPIVRLVDASIRAIALNNNFGTGSLASNPPSSRGAANCKSRVLAAPPSWRRPGGLVLPTRRPARPRQKQSIRTSASKSSRNFFPRLALCEAASYQSTTTRRVSNISD
jgi:hypothetical protein